MEFRVPKTAEEPLAEFAKLPEGQVQNLVLAIRGSMPALRINDFAVNVASSCGLEPQKVRDIIAVFAEMYLARIHAGRSVDAFVSDLVAALQGRGDTELVPSNWPAFADHVRSILSCEDSLGVTAKALDLLTDHEHVLQYVRVITDVRHVFSDDPNQRPKAAVVVHMLNLAYSEIDGMKEMYIALDASDLESLKSAIQRAEAKEENLRTLMGESGVNCLGSH